jgi:hypothetical protein
LRIEQSAILIAAEVHPAIRTPAVHRSVVEPDTILMMFSIFVSE